MIPTPIITRCPWVDSSKPDYIEYHDNEWGVPVHDDQRLFELLTLEAFQAGLSWYTILARRNHFRIAFDQFDPEKVARYDERKVQELLRNPGIIRNRAKVLAAVNNAERFLEVQEELGSFDAFIWGFIHNQPIVNEIRELKEYPAKSPESEAISKALRKRGFSFVGPIVCYAHMQATGMVNDHTIHCYRRREIMEQYKTGSASVEDRAMGERGAQPDEPQQGPSK
jgi:DNA-3-methyladenine glycosylase I